MLVPEQPNPQGAIEWEAVRLQGNESPIVRASRKLIHEERLITNYAPSNLRLTALDPYLWKDTNHINLKQLWDYLSTYTYLPRLKNSEVLRQTIHAGVMNLLWQENYAYATGWDETKQKYLGYHNYLYPPNYYFCRLQEFSTNHLLFLATILSQDPYLDQISHYMRL